VTTILVVDDNPQDAYLLQRVLARDGIEFVEARNGREALERSATREVDLVISDILMPVMDGFSLCREWKAHPARKAIPFVFYTATYVDKKDEELALQAGADLFLVKPAEPALLRGQVEEMLARRRSGQPSRIVDIADEAPFLQEYNSALIRKLEKKMLQLEETNRALRIKDLALASSASGVLLATPAGKISYANPAMARLCGRSAPEIIERDLAELFDASAAPALARLPPSGPVELQLAAALPDAAPVFVQVTGHAVTGEDGGHVGVMLSCLDVSEEKRLRQELARIQRLEALSLFAAGVAHDFNNLLTALAAPLGDTEPPGDPCLTEEREIALAAFERARELTQRLLCFSRGDTPGRQPVDLRRLLDESVSLTLSGSSVRCERRYDVHLPRASGDPGQLSQVFSNLLVNARQAIKREGTVVVSAKELVIHAPGPLPAGRYLAVQVQDDGGGIAPEVLPHIFEPYYTTKPEGSGLGLATSAAIVQAHGGRISVSSRPGGGTTFEVLIPALSAEDAPEAHVRESPQPPRAAPGRILVMDDQPATLALIHRGLERAGHAVVVAGNGEQALLELERARWRGQPFDLTILDITVQGGMGGVQALSRLRQQHPHLPAIATTGYSDRAVGEGLRAHGFSYVLPKPFLLHELLSAVTALLPSDR
jgi:two-component system cell cycle sensor histidine kinase/response regulator CckA